ncbi:MAG: thermonuclease family protein [Dehalococcoidia bacterium]
MREPRRYLGWLRLPRRRRVAILWPLLILLAAFVGFLQLLTTDGGTAGTVTPGPFDSPTPPLQTATPVATPPPFLHPDPQLLEQATVVRIIDGDTIDVRIGGKQERVRYYGIDAPEKGERCYEEATERNRELVGTTVRLEADARNEDEHGHLLRYVFTDDGLSVDAALVSEGLATVAPRDGRYLARLSTLETHAQQEGIGCLWR